MEIRPKPDKEAISERHESKSLQGLQENMTCVERGMRVEMDST